MGGNRTLERPCCVPTLEHGNDQKCRGTSPPTYQGRGAVPPQSLDQHLTENPLQKPECAYARAGSGAGFPPFHRALCRKGDVDAAEWFPLGAIFADIAIATENQVRQLLSLSHVVVWITVRSQPMACIMHMGEDRAGAVAHCLPFCLV